ncbi:MAG: hypothetical protein F6K31_07260 [Symploca sp. SIO2G7]|nr:hypothetical protein [Symploca sp. SIO2G7]
MSYEGSVKRIKGKRRGSITVTALHVKGYPWNREQVKRRLRIPESTLVRYLTEIVAMHIPEFEYVPNQREFDKFQVNTLRWLRRLYRRGLRTPAIIHKIEDGVLLDEYEKAVKG